MIKMRRQIWVLAVVVLLAGELGAGTGGGAGRLRRVRLSASDDRGADGVELHREFTPRGRERSPRCDTSLMRTPVWNFGGEGYSRIACINATCSRTDIFSCFRIFGGGTVQREN